MQTVLPGNGLALVPAANGVITRWRVRTAAGPVGSVRLRVARRDPNGQYESISSATSHATLAAGGVQTFDTRQPIDAGEVIGLDLDQAAEVLALDAPRAEGVYWEPRLISPAAPTGSDDDVELMFNADIEPDADDDGYGDETQDGCPSEATVVLTGCPVDLAVE